jgi:hypothetical protein
MATEWCYSRLYRDQSFIFSASFFIICYILVAFVLPGFHWHQTVVLPNHIFAMCHPCHDHMGYLLRMPCLLHDLVLRPMLQSLRYWAALRQETLPNCHGCLLRTMLDRRGKILVEHPGYLAQRVNFTEVSSPHSYSLWTITWFWRTVLTKSNPWSRALPTR